MVLFSGGARVVSASCTHYMKPPLYSLQAMGRISRAVRAPQKKLHCRQNNKNRYSSKNVTITADIFTSGRSFSCTNSSGELGLSGGKSTDVKILIRNDASPYGDHCSGKGP